MGILLMFLKGDGDLVQQVLAMKVHLPGFDPQDPYNSGKRELSPQKLSSDLHRHTVAHISHHTPNVDDDNDAFILFLVPCV